MRINYARLGVDTIATLAQRTIETSEKAEFTALVKDNPLLAQLKKTYGEYFEVFNKVTFSGMGVDVQKADLKRDNFFRGLYRILLSMSNMEGMSLQQDAKELLPFFEPYGFEITRFSYGDETAYLNKLIEALDKPEVIAGLEKLNLKEPFTLLKKSQEDFEKLFSSQAGTNASLREMESATSLKGNLVYDLRNYLSMVNAMRDVDAWEPFYNELNEIVKAASNSSAVHPPQILPPPPMPG
ncbi:conserved hypothetical protein [uncultured Paludibacter sp.]|nr:conserved hypothetical protein [uncultured Paludibacter sp.]